MSATRRMKELLAADTAESFLELVRLLRGKAPGPDERAALEALATEEVPAAQLVRALERAHPMGHRYEEQAAPPYDYRSRMLVEDLLAAAGKRRLEAARPLILSLLLHRDLSARAAHALERFGDDQALEAAVRLLPSVAGTARSVLLRLALAKDAAAAPERLAALLSDPAVVRDLLYVLWRDSRDPKRGHPAWAEDPRWKALGERTRDNTDDRELKAMLLDLYPPPLKPDVRALSAIPGRSSARARGWRRSRSSSTH